MPTRHGLFALWRGDLRRLPLHVIIAQFPNSKVAGNSMSIRLSNGKEIPIEMHKIRIVQKVRLAPVRERLQAMEAAGYNTFLLRTRDIFLDMLTDSGTNAMSDNQQAAMLHGRRRLCGLGEFLQAGGCGERDSRLRVSAAGSSGSRRRAPACQDLYQTRHLYPHELSLHHH